MTHPFHLAFLIITRNHLAIADLLADTVQARISISVDALLLKFHHVEIIDPTRLAHHGGPTNTFGLGFVIFTLVVFFFVPRSFLRRTTRARASRLVVQWQYSPRGKGRRGIHTLSSGQ